MVNGGVLEVAGGGSGCQGALGALPDAQARVCAVLVPCRQHFSACSRDEPLAVGPRAGMKFGGLLAFLHAPRLWLRRWREHNFWLVQRVQALARPVILSRVGRRRLRPVLKHGPRSLTCVRVIGLTKPKGAVKAKGIQFLRGDALSCGNPGASRRPRLVRSSKSIHVGTRKMVNYAWPG